MLWSWELRVLMYPEDEIGIITEDGKFRGICAKSYEFIHKHADRIHEAMIAVMKVPEHRRGFWVWKICHGWTQVQGERILLEG